MAYDALNRLAGRRFSDGSRQTFGYDAVGNRTGWPPPEARTTTLTFHERTLRAGGAARRQDHQLQLRRERLVQRHPEAQQRVDHLHLS
jgi:YD repeat-containing protein